MFTRRNENPPGPNQTALDLYDFDETGRRYLKEKLWIDEEPSESVGIGHIVQLFDSEHTYYMTIYIEHASSKGLEGIERQIVKRVIHSRR